MSEAATATAERDAAMLMAERVESVERITLAAPFGGYQASRLAIRTRYSGFSRSAGSIS